MEKWKPYQKMLSDGKSPEHILQIADENGLSFIDKLAMMRSFYKLTIVEAKEIVICANSKYESLGEYQSEMLEALEKAMSFQFLSQVHAVEVNDLYNATFTASENAEEGALIGQLGEDLAKKIDDKDVIGLGTFDDEKLIAAIFLSKLFCTESVEVYMLAPVAVATEHQRKGIGQTLINYGIDILQERNADVLITYGDPAYYAKTGFEKLSEEVIPAPYPLAFPFGCLGQSLNGESIPKIAGPTRCVEPFNNPKMW